MFQLLNDPDKPRRRYVLGEPLCFWRNLEFRSQRSCGPRPAVYTPGGREFRVPLNFTIAGKEIPVGVGLITLTLLTTAVVNLFTKTGGHCLGHYFSVHYSFFLLSPSEDSGGSGGKVRRARSIQSRARSRAHAGQSRRPARQHPCSHQHKLPLYALESSAASSQTSRKPRSSSCTFKFCSAQVPVKGPDTGSAL